MLRRLGILAVVTLCAAALGCGDSTSAAKKTYGGRGRVASTSGGPVVLTYDERVAVATNRTSGVVSVFRLDPTRDPEDVVRGTLKEFDVGVDAKPWAAVIGADDDTAYVLLRGIQAVVRIRNLHDGPKLDLADAIPVGTDPTDIAITPSGNRLYVANFGEGTVSMITTVNLAPQQSTDLNYALARTGVLGTLESSDAESQGFWSVGELRTVRPGLAHPRALAITDDGDTSDEGEILYATEFFSQPILDTTSTDPDEQRQGFVYAINLDTGQLRQQDQNPIALAPVDTGFDDAEGTPTKCFPNQLYAAAVHESRLYVTSMCASPRGPVGLGPADTTVNLRALVHPAVFVVDVAPAAQQEMTELGGVLTKKLHDVYESDATVGRMPLIPNDIVVAATSEGPRAYVTAFGADAVFAVDYGVSATPSSRFIDLRPGGRLPVGIALSRNAGLPFALILNDYSDLLSVVSVSEGRVSRTVPAVNSPPRAIAEVREGRRMFATGLDVWSAQSRAHSSCESCHPDGLSDGVVWRFPRGPRRTISTAGTYFPDQVTRRMLLWTANVDEVHDVEVIARGVSGGIGGVVWNDYGLDEPSKDCRLLYDGSPASTIGGTESCPAPKTTTHRLNGLNGALGAVSFTNDNPPCDETAETCDVNGSHDWDAIDAFIRSVRAPKAPRICDTAERFETACLDGGLVSAGRDLFRRAKCAGCHGGPGWTISTVFYEPSLDNNGALPSVKPTPVVLDPDGSTLAAMRGNLRVRTYDAGELSLLNPPASLGSATFRNWSPAPDAVDPNQAALDFLYGSSDQINCVLRAVGTFPAQEAGGSATLTGIVAPGVTPLEESRRNLVAPPMDAEPGTLPTYQTTLAVGRDGFNVPSLVGLELAGPFFHAGNARTLEEAFHDTFAAHHRSPVFAPDVVLTRDDVRALVSYLLSIDDDTEPVLVPSPETGELSFNPDLCAQFGAR
jgi:DNA-binding beta-propeller fold protein YncE